MIHHIEINVSDLQRSKTFWGGLLELLGYQLHQEWQDGFSFIFDGTYIVFVQAVESRLTNSYHRKNIGLNHIAFSCGNCDMIERASRWAIDAGSEILYPQQHPYAGGPDHYAVYFEDPDRIKVEIVAARIKDV